LPISGAIFGGAIGGKWPNVSKESFGAPSVDIKTLSVITLRVISIDIKAVDIESVKEGAAISGKSI